MAGKAEGQQGTVWGPAEHLGTPLGALRACGSLTQPLRLSWWVCPNIPRSHLHPLLLPSAVCGEARSLLPPPSWADSPPVLSVLRLRGCYHPCLQAKPQGEQPGTRPLLRSPPAAIHFCLASSPLPPLLQQGMGRWLGRRALPSLRR